MSTEHQLNLAQVCDPSNSVVVSACAGSGKTWLLVARLVRILLNDAAPRSILALTFTRKAAQEMRERLYQLLQQWTQLNDADLCQELVERGLDADQACALIPKARTLYERLLAQPHAIAIDTFHGWFGYLLAGAPLSMGAQQGFTLREDAKRLQNECLEDWWASMPTELLSHYELLLNQLGSQQTQQFLLGASSLLRQKGAWVFFEKWCKARGMTPLDVLKRQLADLQTPNPLQTKLAKPDAIPELRLLLQCFAHGGTNDQKYVPDLEQALEDVERAQWDAAIDALVPVFMTRDELPSYRKDNDKVSKDLLRYLNLIQQDSDGLIAIRQSWGRACEQSLEWQATREALALNEAWFALSTAIFKHTQRVKERLRVRDFDDLELGVAQMMSDPQVAAYLQARLDARYQHILIDEFQDTNPLQWQILKSWLEAYGDDLAKPKVFIVGDPKQSIYRFRRADPRLFVAATQFLQKHYGAHLQQQNTTRRNAPTIVQALNAIFVSTRLPPSYPFQNHHTLWTAPPANGQTTPSKTTGEAYRLPLIPYEEQEPRQRSTPALDAPLIDHRTTPAKQQRLLEGQRAARLIKQVLATRLVLDEEFDQGARQQKRKVWRSARPSDFLILVKRRHYLPEYEEALRKAKLLYDSPRLGGLLETLEVDDLIALLTVLESPSSDLALGQVLRSPLYGLNEEHMQYLAELVQSNRGYRTWWEALKHTEKHHHIYFQDIALQMESWIALAKRLPVHDLLDHIYFSGDLRSKYASACQDSDREQVLANLDAFLELALNLDGGRYPSLGRFIAHLNQMRRGDEDETPDEGEISSDAFLDNELDEAPEEELADPETETQLAMQRQQRVRLLTIHGAKGLEAPFVIVLDANNTAMPNLSRGVLLDWDPDQLSPSHLSMFTKVTLAKAREDLKAQEKYIALNENWNLFYVALTRAKQGVWLSGVESAKNRKHGGLLSDSWYDRALQADLPLFEELDSWSDTDLAFAGAQSPASISTSQSSFEFRDIVLRWQGEPAPENEGITVSAHERQRISEGNWFHGVLQRITPQQYRPAPKQLPTPNALADLFGISVADAQRALQRALQVSQSQNLAAFFDPAHYLFAWNELDVMSADGKNLRIDRLVEFTNELVILDYKLSIPDQSEPLFCQYQKQLSNYLQALKPLYPHKPMRALLIDAQGHSTPV